MYTRAPESFHHMLRQLLGWATGQSFAIIAFIQHPDQNGQVLLLAGENGEGTEAAGRLVVDLPRLASTLKRCGVSSSGPPQHFEILLHLNTMDNYLRIKDSHSEKEVFYAYGS